MPDSGMSARAAGNLFEAQHTSDLHVYKPARLVVLTDAVDDRAPKLGWTPNAIHVEIPMVPRGAALAVVPNVASR